MIHSINGTDLDYLLYRLPRNLRYHLIEAAKIGKSYIIAGGFIRAVIGKEKVNDIDIFCANEADAEYLADILCPTRSHRHETENAVSFTVDGHSVQIIHKFFFLTYEDLFKHFDFTVAQAAMSYSCVKKEWLTGCTPDFYPDLAAKRMKYTNPENPEAGSSLLRLFKFHRRGYYIPMETIAEVVGALTSTEAESIQQDLKEFSNAI